MKFFRDIIVPILVGLAVFALFQVSVGTFKVYGTSMLPGIEQGDYILVSKARYFFDEPQRGSVIVFHSPQEPNTDLIKRIIAVPGDTVEIKNNTVFVNDIPLSEPYILEAPKYTYYRQQIDANQYFVLGDNRNNSSDSHRGWTLPRENIIGKAWITYWPPYRWRTMKHYNLNAGMQAAEIAESSLIMKILCPTR
jgi:signal peptidase I